MSLKAMVWAMNDAPVDDPTELLVLYALAERSGEDGTAAFPAISWLARRARCSERTVRRKLKSLQDKGVIRKGDSRFTEWIRADRRPAVWDIDMEVTEESVKKATGCQIVTPQKMHGVSDCHPAEDARGDTAVSERGDTAVSERGDTAVSYKPSFNHPLTVQPPLTCPPLALDVTRVTSSESDSIVEAEIQQASFDEFWQAYPRKVGKRAGQQAWDKALKRDDGHRIVESTRAFAELVKAENRETRFIPHPATWLNRDSWLDDIAAEQPKQGNPFLSMLQTDGPNTPKTGVLSPQKSLPTHG